MTTTTHELSGRFLHPVLVSDLPPVDEPRPGLVARLRSDLAQRRVDRDFETALRTADGHQRDDLMALNRRR